MAKHRHKSDTAALKKYLTARKTSLFEVRTHIEELWKELRKFYEPKLGKALLDGDSDANAATRDDDAILNSAPRTQLHRMAAGLQSGITNQSRAWFKLRCMKAELEKIAAVRRWLDESTEAIASIMNRSNVYTSFDMTYLHLGEFGTAAGICFYDEIDHIHVDICDAGAYWIAEDRRGRVDTLLRRREMTLDQMVDEFGEGWMPDILLEKWSKGSNEQKQTVWHYVGKNLKPELIREDTIVDVNFVSLYWIEGVEDDNNGILAIRAFSYNPIIAPRWTVIGSVYGVGCGEIGLGDAKQLQQMEADKLRMIENEVDPAMLAAASMKAEPINNGAGGVTYTPDTMTGNSQPVRRLFETQQKIESVLIGIRDTEERLSRTFFQDLFAMMINLNMRPKQMTAREVNELSGEKVALLGPILTRLNTDLLNPIVDAIFTIAVENNLLPPIPEVLEGQDLKIEYVSSLHIEQAASSRLSGMYRILDIATAIAQVNQSIVDKLDTDKMLDISATVLTEGGVVRDEKTVQAIRAEKARQQQAMIQAEMLSKQAPAIAGAARDLSETKVETGNALEALAEQQGK